MEGHFKIHTILHIDVICFFLSFYILKSFHTFPAILPPLSLSTHSRILVGLLTYLNTISFHCLTPEICIQPLLLPFPILIKVITAASYGGCERVKKRDASGPTIECKKITAPKNKQNIGERYWKRVEQILICRTL